MTDDSSIYKTHTRACVYVFKKTTVILSSVIPQTTPQLQSNYPSTTTQIRDLPATTPRPVCTVTNLRLLASDSIRQRKNDKMNK